MSETKKGEDAVSRLVAKFGGPAKVSQILDVAPSSVTYWLKTGKIPAVHHQPLMKYALANGILIAPDEVESVEGIALMACLIARARVTPTPLNLQDADREYKQDELVSFVLAEGISGIGKICGKSYSMHPVMGKSWIVELSTPIAGYPFTHTAMLGVNLSPLSDRSEASESAAA